MTSLRQSLRAALRHGMRIGVSVLVRVVPSRRSVLIGLGQDDEDNGLVMAARLADGSAGPVTMSCDDPGIVRPRLDAVAQALGLDASAVRLVRKFGPADAYAFVTSRLVLYTHGMYGSPAVAGRRVHVNLWHGSGPKWIGHGFFTQYMGARYVVASARHWGRETARALEMSPDTALLTGNPRQDLLHVPVDRAVLHGWGLDPDRPVVVWMPTFRSSSVVGQGTVTQGATVSGAMTSEPLMRRLIEEGTRAGVQFVVKTHPYDTDDWDSLPITRLTSEDLWAHGLSIYRFLTLADGMLSDYSSVWVDYLALDRPIGLYCPDLDSYAADRGLNEPSMAVAAEDLLITDADDVARFVTAVSTGVVDLDGLARVREALDYVPTDPSPSGVLVGELMSLLDGARRTR